LTFLKFFTKNVVKQSLTLNQKSNKLYINLSMFVIIDPQTK